MIENTKLLERIIKQIAEEKISFGNKLLYDMCVDKEGQRWNDLNVLADKVWLIGRSYAASPERRYTTGKSPKVVDGTGDYFKNIAEYILNHVKIDSESKYILKNKKFRFDFSTNDVAILLTGINYVMEFNLLIKRASRNYDEGFIEDKNYKNQISFCSKFLHFHFPDTIFIIDSFSRMGASYLFSKGTRTNATIKWQSDRVGVLNESTPKGAMNLLLEYEPYVVNNKKFEYEFTKKLNELKLDSYVHGKDYAEHCLRAYKTACLFKMFLGKNVPLSSYPRKVDTLLLNIKSANNYKDL